MTADAVITGIGLLSGIGEGGDAHWRHLATAGAAPVIDAARFAPYCVHPLGDVDFSSQIPKKSELRQMEPWQRIGTFAAGLALADAGLAGQLDQLGRMHMIVAAGSGERDTATDMKVLDAIATRGNGDVRPNEVLSSNLRPTLFLAQLSNLLAGNISIAHKVTGSSRTFMGEEMAGIAAVETAVRRIQSGQGDVFLIGGAFNAERADALLNFDLGDMLLEGGFAPVWERAKAASPGFAPASLGAFLVIEERQHATARGARIYARIAEVRSGRCARRQGEAERSVNDALAAMRSNLADGPLAVLSGASGAEPATREELAFLAGLDARGLPPAVRAYGSRLGHAVEAHFPAGIALAALALSHGGFYPPFDTSGVERPYAGPLSRVMVTSFGHWRGEGLALLTAMET